MSLYGVLLALHNILRWVVVITAGLALYRAYRGLATKSEWNATDRKAGVFFGVSMDIQLLLGLILYLFLSEFGLKNFLDSQRGMAFIQSAGGDYIFFAMEHIFSMIIATVLAHVGSARAKKAADSLSKHRQAAIFYSLAVLFVLTAIPWWRPLFPGL